MMATTSTALNRNRISLRVQMVVLLICVHCIVGRDFWQKPGCHKVGTASCDYYILCYRYILWSIFQTTNHHYIGHKRKISIPDCVEFSIETNACRGYCESYAVPSAPLVLLAGSGRPPKPVTSIGQCCNIMESEDVFVYVNCVDGPKNITFKSATKCSCYHCKKD